MCKEFESNRRLITQLVYSKGDFFEEEIVQEYQQQRSSLMVDGSLDVSHFLRRLAELKVINLTNGRYFLRR